MVEAGRDKAVSYSVVINPNSGPGYEVNDLYQQGMYDLWDAGVEVRNVMTMPY